MRALDARRRPRFLRKSRPEILAPLEPPPSMNLIATSIFRDRCRATHTLPIPPAPEQPEELEALVDDVAFPEALTCTHSERRICFLLPLAPELAARMFSLISDCKGSLIEASVIEISQDGGVWFGNAFSPANGGALVRPGAGR